MQRTGRTSVGKFFRDFGFRWAGWPADSKNGWSSSWYEGDYEAIFSSTDFRSANAYEDSPWFLPDFYKVLYHRFPDSKFILFTRDADEWFQSMMKHSGGDVVGDNRIHCKIYRRELEFFDLLLSGHLSEEIYRLHNTEVIDFFRRHAPESLYSARLEDPDKWKRLGEFLGVQVLEGYKSHENPSKG